MKIKGYEQKQESVYKNKLTIRQNIYGNWSAFCGNKKVKEIGASKYDADLWLNENKKNQGKG